jgi:hypothetical protein
MNFDYEVDVKHGLNKLLVVEFKEFVELNSKCSIANGISPKK